MNGSPVENYLTPQEIEIIVASGDQLSKLIPQDKEVETERTSVGTVKVEIIKALYLEGYKPPKRLEVGTRVVINDDLQSFLHAGLIEPNGDNSFPLGIYSDEIGDISAPIFAPDGTTLLGYEVVTLDNKIHLVDLDYTDGLPECVELDRIAVINGENLVVKPNIVISAAKISKSLEESKKERLKSRASDLDKDFDFHDYFSQLLGLTLSDVVDKLIEYKKGLFHKISEDSVIRGLRILSGNITTRYESSRRMSNPTRDLSELTVGSIFELAQDLPKIFGGYGVKNGVVDTNYIVLNSFRVGDNGTIVIDDVKSASLIRTKNLDPIAVYPDVSTFLALINQEREASIAAGTLLVTTLMQRVKK